MGIVLTTYENIDLIKWDICISKSVNSCVCAYSWYLTLTSKNWAALIKDDYDAVMPIALENNEVVMPNLTPWLGVFSKDLLTADTLNIFFNELTKYYNIKNIKLNKFNLPDKSIINFTKHKVYQYDMITDHNTRQLWYSPNIKTMLNTCDKERLYVKQTINNEEFSRQIISNFSNSQPHSQIAEILMINKHYNTLMLELKNAKKETIGGAYAFGEKALFLPYLWVKRKYNKDYARFKLIDSVLEYYQNRNLTLYVFTNQYAQIEPEILTQTGALEYEYYGYEKEPRIKDKILNILKL